MVTHRTIVITTTPIMNKTNITARVSSLGNILQKKSDIMTILCLRRKENPFILISRMFDSEFSLKFFNLEIDFSIFPKLQSFQISQILLIGFKNASPTIFTIFCIRRNFVMRASCHVDPILQRFLPEIFVCFKPCSTFCKPSSACNRARNSCTSCQYFQPKTQIQFHRLQQTPQTKKRISVFLPKTINEIGATKKSANQLRNISKALNILNL